MRQFGALHGNVWESDSEFLAAKARAIENEEASREIAEQLDAQADLDALEGLCIHCETPQSLCACDLGDFYDDVLQVWVDHSPITRKVI